LSFKQTTTLVNPVFYVIPARGITCTSTITFISKAMIAFVTDRLITPRHVRAFNYRAAKIFRNDRRASDFTSAKLRAAHQQTSNREAH
jgi:hypothetical protein